MYSCSLSFHFQACTGRAADVRAAIAQCHPTVSETEYVQERDGHQRAAVTQVCSHMT